MVVLLFGPPGCGKGTQSPWIARWLGAPAISTGEMLRAEIAADSELGQQVQSVLAAGRLAEDHLVNGALVHRLQERDCRDGFLLDGYPRTVAQARFLDELLESKGAGEPVVIHLETPPAVLVERMSARRQCPSCLRIYNLLHRQPRREGVCDHDGSELARRRDDHADVIAERLRAYAELTNPVLSYYEGRHCYAIDADRGPEQVFADIETILSEFLVSVRRPRGSQ